MQRKSIRLTLLGSIDEVGGNTVLLDDLNYDIRIFIDFGINTPVIYEKYNIPDIKFLGMMKFFEK